MDRVRGSMIDSRHGRSRRGSVPRLIGVLLLLLQGLFALLTGYLLLLLGAAAARRRHPAPGGAEEPRFIVLVPAHNEEVGIAATLASLRALDYPRDRYEVVVIADNCDDRTAPLARAAGATVLERTDPALRGKGHALAWALGRLLPARPDADAIVFLDADCQVSPNLLRALAARLVSGAAAVQADYVVANPGASWSSGLRFAAFALNNTVAPLGQSALGLSCGLLGNGMAFRRDLLERQPWTAFTLAEDAEYHARLVAAGERVVFAPEARVTSPMPTTLREARQQNLRWEGGKWLLIRTWAPRLLAAGLRRRDPGALHAGLRLLLPPQSLLLGGNLALAALAAALRHPLGRRLAALQLLGQAGYVLGGLALVRAPAGVYRALALAPVLMAWKIGLYLKILAGRGPRGWVRTDRERPAPRAAVDGVSADSEPIVRQPRAQDPVSGPVS